MRSGVSRKNPTHVTQNSIFVCIPCFKSVSPMAKVPFLAFWGPNMNMEMGVVIYMHLKHHSDCIDSIYIYGLMVKLLRFKCFGDIPFFIVLAIHRIKKRCGQV